jgi:ATP-dependent protease ClpP protease subunit
VNRPVGQRAPLRRPVNFTRPPTAKAGHWYEIRNQTSTDAELHVYDEIGYWGVTAAEFVKELQALDVDSIRLHINSPGGDVFDGLAILNALRQHRARIDVTVDGLAASAASFIAMCGDTVMMAPQSMMMIHDAAGMAWGDARELRSTADLLDKVSGNIADVYTARAGGTAAEWRARMLDETWLTAAEAVLVGLADGILGQAGDDDPTPDAPDGGTTTPDKQPSPDDKTPTPTPAATQNTTPAPPQAPPALPIRIDLGELRRTLMEDASA